jgi:membrane protease YdiL (CAAX protease family)
MKELFFNYPLAVAAYSILMLATISIWIHKKIYIWGSLLVIALAFSYYGKIIEESGFVFLGILALSYFYSSKPMPPFWKIATLITTTIITIGAYTHQLKGFNNLLVFSKYRLSTDAIYVNIYANFDKGVISILILGLLTKVIETKKELARMLLILVPYSIFSCFIILFFSNYFHLIKYDPKFPMSAILWLIIQIFFVVIPEETFYRGYVQKEIYENLKDHRLKALIAVISQAALFSLLHLFIIPKLSILAISFGAGLLYGGIYQLTKRIESSILLHLSVNVVHFFFFTYPALN